MMVCERCHSDEAVVLVDITEENTRTTRLVLCVECWCQVEDLNPHEKTARVLSSNAH